MTKIKTIFHQLQQFLPNHSFSESVKRYSGNHYIKKLTSRNHLMLMLYAHATEKESLRDIETSISVHNDKFNELDIKSISKSSLSRLNRQRSYKIFEELYYDLLKRCNYLLCKQSTKPLIPSKLKVYALDSSSISVCLSLFKWAKYKQLKGAIKIHPLLNLETQIPEFMTISNGKVNDLAAAKEMQNRILSILRDSTRNKQQRSVIVFDKGYIGYKWFYKFTKNNIIFVTRERITMAYKVLGQHEIKSFIKDNSETEISLNGYCLKDEIIQLTSKEARKFYPGILRRIVWYDKDQNNTYTFNTNNFDLSPEVISLVYKRRWDIELFFKWIKQNLKIKTFLGTNKNAVLIQIWTAMIYYLLRNYIRTQTKYSKSLLTFTRLIAEALFKELNIIDLLALNNTERLKKIYSDSFGRQQLQLFTAWD